MENAAEDKPVALLCVEDDAEIREQLVSLLNVRYPRLSLLTAENGREGLDLYACHRPDIVLADVRMPVMNGIQMVREIKRIDRSALIIVLTAVSETDEILAAIDIGINHYVIKPVVMEKLFTSLERCIEETEMRRLVRRNEASIRRMAYFDALTELPNRQLFSTLFQQALAQAQRHSRRLALLYLDLDGFKIINDTYGHAVGDQLLRSVARRLRQCCQRSEDTIARYGGDEFIILLTDTESPQEPLSIARKIIESFTSPFVLAEQVVLISPSIGISIHPEDGSHEEVLLKHADSAMYDAKKRGRNRFQFFNPSLPELSLPGAAQGV